MALGHGSERSGGSDIERLSATIGNSISLRIALLGVGIIITGYLAQFVDVAWTPTGVWSAIMAIWGTALFLLGLSIYTVIWWSYQ